MPGVHSFSLIFAHRDFCLTCLLTQKYLLKAIFFVSSAYLLQKIALTLLNLFNFWTFNLRDLTEVKWYKCGMEKAEKDLTTASSYLTFFLKSVVDQEKV